MGKKVMFQFGMGEEVRIITTGEVGEIIGVKFIAHYPPSYFVSTVTDKYGDHICHWVSQENLEGVE